MLDPFIRDKVPPSEFAVKKRSFLHFPTSTALFLEWQRAALCAEAVRVPGGSVPPCTEKVKRVADAPEASGLLTCSVLVQWMWLLLEEFSPGRGGTAVNVLHVDVLLPFPSPSSVPKGGSVVRSGGQLHTSLLLHLLPAARLQPHFS